MTLQALQTLEAIFDGVTFRVVQEGRTVSLHIKEADRKIHARLSQRDALVLINALTNAIICAGSLE